jgi:hypothetical protein
MNPGAWSDVLGTMRQIDAAVDKAFGGSPPRPDLALLHGSVQKLLSNLEKKLLPVLGEEALVREVLLPFICLCDEQVLVRLGRLSHNPDVDWARIQADPRYIPSQDGGDVFFEMAEDLLADRHLQGATPEVRTFVLGAYLHGLTRGFEGRYADDPGKLREYEERLFRKITDLGGPPPARPPSPPDAPAPKISGLSRLVLTRPWWLPASIALVVLVVFFLSVRWL